MPAIGRDHRCENGRESFDSPRRGINVAGKRVFLLWRLHNWSSAEFYLQFLEGISISFIKFVHLASLLWKISEWHYSVRDSFDAMSKKCRSPINPLGSDMLLGYWQSRTIFCLPVSILIPWIPSCEAKNSVLFSSFHTLICQHKADYHAARRELTTDVSNNFHKSHCKRETRGDKQTRISQ